MNDFLKLLEPYIAHILIAFFALIILYIKTFTAEKAKIKALKSENKSLTQETESIKKEFELENLYNEFK